MMKILLAISLIITIIVGMLKIVKEALEIKILFKSSIKAAPAAPEQKSNKIKKQKWAFAFLIFAFFVLPSASLLKYLLDTRPMIRFDIFAIALSVGQMVFGCVLLMQDRILKALHEAFWDITRPGGRSG